MKLICFKLELPKFLNVVQNKSVRFHGKIPSILQMKWLDTFVELVITIYKLYFHEKSFIFFLYFHIYFVAEGPMGGSLLITTVNQKKLDEYQLVYGTPKLVYPYKDFETYELAVPECTQYFWGKHLFLSSSFCSKHSNIQ
jgi:hypothetical protein